MTRHTLLLLASLLLTSTPARAEGPPGLPGPLRLSLSLWRGGPAWGALVGLQVPMDMTGARPRAAAAAAAAGAQVAAAAGPAAAAGAQVAGAGASAGTPVAATPVAATPVAGTPVAGSAGAEGAAGGGEAEAARRRVTPARMRRLLRAAWRAAGVDEGRLDAMATRARASALLPDVQVRASRGDDLTLRTTELATDQRAQATGQGSTFYEARLTLRLGRLVFADEEVAIERLRQDMQQQRVKVTQRLAELVGAWQRGQARVAAAGAVDDAEALAAAEAASVALDAMTDGAWTASAP